MPSFCTGLRELSVSDCVNITDFGLYELAKLGSTLRYLSVAKCDQVSDAGLKVIARRCYKLRYLNARGCEAVGDDSIIMLAHSCARLRALDIGKCDVSDAALHALAESCPNLKKISLKNCDMITDRGIQCVAYYCRGLQLLNIQDCQITIEGYRAVKMYCKRCVVEHTNPGFGWKNNMWTLAWNWGHRLILDKLNYVFYYKYGTWKPYSIEEENRVFRKKLPFPFILFINEKKCVANCF